jgi:hypothetical protein
MAGASAHLCSQFEVRSSTLKLVRTPVCLPVVVVVAAVAFRCECHVLV